MGWSRRLNDIPTANDGIRPCPELLVGLAITFPAAALSLAECVQHSLHHHLLRFTEVGYVVLPYGAGLLGALLLTSALWLIRSFGRCYVVSLLLGVAFAQFLLFNFRGPLYWHGLFDLEGRPVWWAYIWPIPGLAVGMVLSLLVQSAVPYRAFLNLAVLVLPTSILFILYKQFVGEDVFSMYPLTRHIALVALYVIVFLAVAGSSKLYPELWESLE